MHEEIIPLDNHPEKRHKFLAHLLKDLETLEQMLQNGAFSDRTVRVGFEQELDLVDESFKPSPIAIQLLNALKDENITTEFAKFNLEINSSPYLLKGNCFSQIQQKLEESIRKIEKEASKRGVKLVLTGILPTLQVEHLSEEMLTPLPRYQELAKVVKKYRGDNYEFHIKNVDELITRTNPGSFGGAFTSFQFHLQIHPDEIAEKFNWSQALLAPILALSANSPIFLGKRLWHETRVPLFQQTTDIRRPYSNYTEQSARVSMGTGWVKDSILEVLKSNLSHYPALIAPKKIPSYTEETKEGEVPKLSAFQFYNGTIYPWNRICYGITDGKPHLRIENRIFPAGPTVVDEVANAAFWVGLMQGIPEYAKNIAAKMSYTDAVNNFQKAARFGFGVEFTWLEGRKISARDLIVNELLPLAIEGLRKMKINAREIEKYMSIVRERAQTQQNGAAWLLSNYDLLLERYSREEALETVTSGLYRRQQKGDPVHLWNNTNFKESEASISSQASVKRIMTTNIISINENAPLKLALKIFTWESINHLPVENDAGELSGLLSKRTLFDLLVEEGIREHHKTVKKAMSTDFIKLKSNATIYEAMNIMLDSHITCLPVVDENTLMGLVTQHDFVRFSSHLIEKIEHAENNSK